MTKQSQTSEGQSCLSNYVHFNANTSLDIRPFNETDALVLDMLSYINWEYAEKNYAREEKHNTVNYSNDFNLSLRDVIERLPDTYINQLDPSQQELLEEVRKSTRYGDMVLRCYKDQPIVSSLEKVQEDPTSIQQFSAMTIVYQDSKGTHNHIAIRGTDGTIQGWYEDFNMSYDGCTEAQIRSVEYTNEIAHLLDGTIELSGHSKGGNGAAFAYLFADEDVKARISHVYTFDAPGFSNPLYLEDADGTIVPLTPELLDDLQKHLTAVAPYNSVVGQLMDETACIFVDADGAILVTHNAFTWIMDEETGAFQWKKQSWMSGKLNVLFDEVLNTLTDTEKQNLFDGIFGYFIYKDFYELDQFGENLMENIQELIRYYQNEAAPEQREALLSGVIALWEKESILPKGMKEEMNKVLSYLTGEEKQAVLDSILGFIVSLDSETLNQLSENPLALIQQIISYGQNEMSAEQQKAILLAITAVLIGIVDCYLKKYPQYRVVRELIARTLNEMGIYSLSDFVDRLIECAQFLEELFLTIFQIPEILDFLVEIWNQSEVKLWFENLLEDIITIGQFMDDFFDSLAGEIAVILFYMEALMEVVTQNWEEFEANMNDLINSGVTVIQNLGDQLMNMVREKMDELMNPLLQNIQSRLEKDFLIPAEKAYQTISSFASVFIQAIKNNVQFCMGMANAVAKCIADGYFYFAVTLDLPRLERAVEKMEQLAGQVERLDIRLSNLYHLLQNRTVQEQAEQEKDTSFIQSIVNYYNLVTADFHVDQGEVIKKKAAAIRKLFDRYAEAENWAKNFADLF